MKAFFVIVMLTNWHGRTEQHVRPAGWTTEHQCHLRAHWMEEQHPRTRAWCEVERYHHR